MAFFPRLPDSLRPIMEKLGILKLHLMLSQEWWPRLNNLKTGEVSIGGLHITTGGNPATELGYGTWSAYNTLGANVYVWRRTA